MVRREGERQVRPDGEEYGEEEYGEARAAG